MIRFGIDADSGDVVKGNKPVDRVTPAVVEVAKKMPEIEFIIAGNEREIRKYDLPKNISVLNAKAIDPDPHSKKPSRDSSLRVLADGLIESDICGIYSIGSTTKICAVAELKVGRFPEFENGMMPGLLAHIPTKKGVIAMMDLGASTEQDVSTSYGHAIMASSYLTHFMGKKNPKLGILSNGTEGYKGNNFERSLDSKLKSSKRFSEIASYVGRIDRVFDGDADIVITDGSSGNKWLKAVEGAAEFLNWNLKQRIGNMTPLDKARFYSGAVIGGLSKVKDGLTQDLDPREYNCAIALGFNGIFGKGHGISDQRAVECGLALAVKYANEDINSRIRQDFKEYLE